MSPNSGERLDNRSVSSCRDESHMSSLSLMSCIMDCGVSPDNSSFWTMARMSASLERRGSMSARV